MIRTQISLTEDQMRRLRHEARRRHVSLAAVIRDAVERVVPEAGGLVLFGPRTWHRTEPHTDAAPRVTLAFDALP